PGETQPVVSVDEDAALQLDAKVGDTIELSGAGREFTARIAALHRVEQLRVSSANDFVFNPRALTGLPATFYGGVRMNAADVGALQRAAYKAFPTVTVINVAEAIILAASVAGTRFRRVREVVILKTLGATRRHAGRIFSVEFLTLGAIA